MNKFILLLGLVFGVASNLYVPTPFGYVGMFDLVCYVLGPVLFLKTLKGFSIREHRFLGLILLWIFGSFLANRINGYSGAVTLKAIGVTSSMWCMCVVCLVLLKRNPKVALYFILGSSIGAVIGLYMFQNGALLNMASEQGYSEGYMGEFLIEKQVLPSWLSLFCVSGVMAVMLVWKRTPVWMASVIFLFAAYFVLYRGGSRSTFGVYLVVGLLSLGVAFSRPMLKQFLKNSVLFFGITLTIVYLAFAIYKYLASSGSLGTEEQDKFEVQFGEEAGLSENLSERGGYSMTLEDFMQNPLGSGGVGALRHSAISDGIYKEGLFAIPFWFYLLWVIIYFLRHHLLTFERWAPFVGFYVGFVIWNTLASPFGGRGAYCLAGCLAVLSAHPEFMRKWQYELEKDRQSGKFKKRFNRRLLEKSP